MTKITKEQYSKFCFAWEERLNENFPDGFDITVENLTWAYQQDRCNGSGSFGLNICYAIEFLLTIDLQGRWSALFRWHLQPKDVIINLAYRVLTEEKLTEEMMTECGVVK